MKLPVYSRYKPGGAEWLADMPEHWEAARSKHSAFRWRSAQGGEAMNPQMTQMDADAEKRILAT
jgi:hypothetical protein